SDVCSSDLNRLEKTAVEFASAERTPMKRILLAAVAALTTLIAWSVYGASSSGYQEVKDWPRLPAGVQLGEVAGVDVDHRGHVFVFHRPGRGFEPSATELLEQPRGPRG